ncbi:hypothetical protein A5669_04960 [Mycolicibacterium fortuitum]|nr:hypothetical protein A5669_04960 [Mycolicibacterium fortuitum]
MNGCAPREPNTANWVTMLVHADSTDEVQLDTACCVQISTIGTAQASQARHGRYVLQPVFYFCRGIVVFQPVDVTGRQWVRTNNLSVSASSRHAAAWVPNMSATMGSLMLRRPDRFANAAAPQDRRGSQE